MDILVFSDTHGRIMDMMETIRFHKPDAVVHLGDYAEDSHLIQKTFPDIPLYAVKGNNDSFSVFPGKLFLKLCGKRLFLTHGHQYSVKNGYVSIIHTAMCAGADILLFGHTHIPYYAVRDGMHVINPGSIGFNGTYGRLVLSEKEIRYTSLTVSK